MGEDAAGKLDRIVAWTIWVAITVGILVIATSIGYDLWIAS
jgi:hypothetical protein